jgi:hypothetical protein
MATILAAVCLALAAWCSRGSLAVTSASSEAARLGLLPSPARLAVLLVVAVVIALAPAARRLRPAPLCLGALALLPWVPGAPVPFLIWSGPATGLVWTAVFVGLIAAQDWGGLGLQWSRAASLVHDPARAPFAAGAAALVLFSSAAWLVKPMHPAGDEPHYLIIAQSLLTDGDLKIENNHQKRQYAPYHPGTMSMAFQRRGTDRQVYSIHAPGLPAVIAPAFAIGGYSGVRVLLLILSSIGAALAWLVAYRASGSVASAWFGWAAVSLSTTTVFQSFAVFPDGLGGVLTLTGVWALLRIDRASPEPSTPSLALHGAALALLPWLHSRFALLAGALGLLIVVRIAQRFDRGRAARGVLAFALVPLLSAAAWFGFFHAVYGTPDPRAPYADDAMGRWSYVTSGLGGLFFDQQFGLLPYAPVLLPVLIALVAGLRRAETRRLSIELMVMLVPYLLAITHFRMWWAGWSAPARFLTPIVFSLAVPAAHLWRRTADASARAALVVLLLCGGFVTATLALVRGGSLVYNVRDGSALWLEWFAPVVALSAGVPSFHRTSEMTAFAHVAIWLACLAGAWLALRALGRTQALGRAALAFVAPALLAVAVMMATAIVWRSSGTDGLAPDASRLHLVRAAGAGLPFAVQVNPPRRIERADLLSRLVLGPIPRFLESADRPLFNMPELPAGRYELRIDTTGRPSGMLSVGFHPEGGRLREIDLSGTTDARRVSVAVSVPVNVRAIAVWGDARARASVARITLLARSIADRSRRATEARARRVARYAPGLVYFFDDNAFPEVEAFWVGGGRATTVAVEEPGGNSMLVRNGPVRNRVTIECGSRRETLDLAEGEERTVIIPRDAGKDTTLVRLASASGFRPSEVNPASQDGRFLGVWVQLR